MEVHDNKNENTKDMINFKNCVNRLCGMLLVLWSVWTANAANIATPSTVDNSTVWEILGIAGSGTQEDPYQIAKPSDLAYLGWAVQNNKLSCFQDTYFIQTADIDFNGDVWTWGTGNNFRGVYDGQGHKISNLLKTTNSKNTTVGGLFCGLGDYNNAVAVFKNVVIENFRLEFNLTDAYDYPKVETGVVFGTMKKNSLIENCAVYNSSIVVMKPFQLTNDCNHFYWGGVVGFCNNTDATRPAIIRNVYSEADLELSRIDAVSNLQQTKYFVGGIVGYDGVAGTVDKTCYNGWVSAKSANVGSFSGNQTGAFVSENAHESILADQNGVGYSTMADAVTVLKEGDESGFWNNLDAESKPYFSELHVDHSKLEHVITLVLPAGNSDDYYYEWSLVGNDGWSTTSHASSATFPTSHIEQIGNVKVYQKSDLTKVIYDKNFAIAAESWTLDASHLNYAGGFQSGDGTKETPYQIANAMQLAWLATTINTETFKINGVTLKNASGIYFVLSEDIDLEGAAWPSIGTRDGGKYFAGHLDGMGHVIKNVKMNIYDPTTNQQRKIGFFSRVSGSSLDFADVKNLILEQVEMFYDGDPSIPNSRCIGCLAGTVERYANVRNIIIRNSKITDSATVGLKVINDGHQFYVGGAIGRIASANAEFNIYNIATDVSIDFPVLTGGHKTASYFGGVFGDNQQTYSANYVYSQNLYGGSRLNVNTYYSQRNPIMAYVKESKQDGRINWYYDNANNCSTTYGERLPKADVPAIFNMRSAESEGELAMWLYDTERGQLSLSFTEQVLFDIVENHPDHQALEHQITIKAHNAEGEDLTSDYAFEWQLPGARIVADNCIAVGTKSTEQKGKVAIYNQKNGMMIPMFEKEFVVSAESWKFDANHIHYTDGFAGGDGSKEDPYQITNALQLAYLSNQLGSLNQCKNQYFVLTDDIDLNGATWYPIGDMQNGLKSFYGSFDGLGHVIRNMQIDWSTYCTSTTEYDLGLFTSINGVNTSFGEVKNLVMDSAKVVYEKGTTLKGTRNIGIIAGRAKRYTTLCNVIVRNSTISDNGLAVKFDDKTLRIGGAVGYVEAGNAEYNIYNIATDVDIELATINKPNMTAKSYIAGISGYLQQTYNAKYEYANNLYSSLDLSTFNDTLTYYGTHFSFINQESTYATYQKNWFYETADNMSVIRGEQKELTAIPEIFNEKVYQKEGLAPWAVENEQLTLMPIALVKVEIKEEHRNHEAFEHTIIASVTDLKGVDKADDYVFDWQFSDIIAENKNEITVATKQYKQGGTVRIFGKGNLEVPIAVRDFVVSAESWQFSPDHIIYSGGFAGGDGSKETPYQIATDMQLALFSNKIKDGSLDQGRDKYFVLTDDIDLQAAEWLPVGDSIGVTVFRGHFDGLGHTIKNVRYDWYDASGKELLIGFFTEIKGEKRNNVNCFATVQNVVFDNAVFTNDYNGKIANATRDMGVLAGAIGQYATVRNIIIRDSKIMSEAPVGDVNQKQLYVGGAIGKVRNNDEINIFNIATDVEFDFENLTNFHATSISPFGGVMGDNQQKYKEPTYAHSQNLFSSSRMRLHERLNIAGTVSGTMLTSVAEDQRVNWFYENSTNCTVTKGTQKDRRSIPAIFNEKALATEDLSTWYYDAEKNQLGFNPAVRNISVVEKHTDNHQALEHVVTLSITGYKGDNVSSDYLYSWETTTEQTTTATSMLFKTSHLDQNGIIKIYDKNDTEKKVLLAQRPFVVSAEEWEFREDHLMYDGGFAGGTGTEEDPYQISNAWELAYLSNHVLDRSIGSTLNKHFVLTHDIDLSGARWLPIGQVLHNGASEDVEKSSYYFQGTFEGNGYVISGMRVDWGDRRGNAMKEDLKYGLFSEVYGNEKLKIYAIAQNVIMEDCEVSIYKPVDNATITGHRSMSIFTSQQGKYAQIRNIIIRSSRINMGGYSVKTSAGIRVGGAIGWVTYDPTAKTFNIVADVDIDMRGLTPKSPADFSSMTIGSQMSNSTIISGVYAFQRDYDNDESGKYLLPYNLYYRGQIQGPANDPEKFVFTSMLYHSTMGLKLNTPENWYYLQDIPNVESQGVKTDDGKMICKENNIICMDRDMKLLPWVYDEVTKQFSFRQGFTVGMKETHANDHTKHRHVMSISLIDQKTGKDVSHTFYYTWDLHGTDSEFGHESFAEFDTRTEIQQGTVYVYDPEDKEHPIFATDFTISAETWGDGHVYSATLQGEGTADSPYLIRTAADLAYMSKYAAYTTDYKYYRLDNNIDLSDAYWTPIGSIVGTDKKNFMGFFDGDGHTISGLKVMWGNEDPNVLNYGLFSSIEGVKGKVATVQNLVIEDVKMFSNVEQKEEAIKWLWGERRVGVVAGRMGDYATLNNIIVRDAIIGDGGISFQQNKKKLYVGGAVGLVEEVSNINIANIAVDAEMDFDQMTFPISYNTADVYVGGIFGQLKQKYAAAYTYARNLFSEVPIRWAPDYNSKICTSGTIYALGNTNATTYRTAWYYTDDKPALLQGEKNVDKASIAAGNNAYIEASGRDYLLQWQHNVKLDQLTFMNYDVQWIEEHLDHSKSQHTITVEMANFVNPDEEYVYTWYKDGKAISGNKKSRTLTTDLKEHVIKVVVVNKTTSELVYEGEYLLNAERWGSGHLYADSYANDETGADRDHPILISNAAQLARLSKDMPEYSSRGQYVYFKLTDDINLNDAWWTPIGYDEMGENYGFIGNLECDGHTISKMNLDWTMFDSEKEEAGNPSSVEVPFGFFATMGGRDSYSAIYNVIFDGTNISNLKEGDSFNRYIGVVAGKTDENSTIANVIVRNGKVTANHLYKAKSGYQTHFGGLVGRVDKVGGTGITIQNAAASVAFSLKNNVVADFSALANGLSVGGLFGSVNEIAEAENEEVNLQLDYLYNDNSKFDVAQNAKVGSIYGIATKESAVMDDIVASHLYYALPSGYQDQGDIEKVRATITEMNNMAINDKSRLLTWGSDDKKFFFAPFHVTLRQTHGRPTVNEHQLSISLNDIEGRDVFSDYNIVWSLEGDAYSAISRVENGYMTSFATLPTAYYARMSQVNIVSKADPTTITYNAEVEAEWYAEENHLMAPETGTGAMTGAGTKENPYVITTANQLARLSYRVRKGEDFSGKYVVLGRDIDLNDALWYPIGDLEGDASFQGNFDGRGYTISNVHMCNATGSDRACDYGLFASIRGTEKDWVSVQNLIIDNAEFIGSRSDDAAHLRSVGILSGQVHKYSSVRNIIIRNSKIVQKPDTECHHVGETFVGGLAGMVSDDGAAAEFEETAIHNITAEVDIDMLMKSDGTEDTKVYVGGIFGILYQMVSDAEGSVFARDLLYHGNVSVPAGNMVVANTIYGEGGASAESKSDRIEWYYQNAVASSDNQGVKETDYIQVVEAYNNAIRDLYEDMDEKPGLYEWTYSDINHKFAFNMFNIEEVAYDDVEDQYTLKINLMKHPADPKFRWYVKNPEGGEDILVKESSDVTLVLSYMLSGYKVYVDVYDGDQFMASSGIHELKERICDYTIHTTDNIVHAPEDETEEGIYTYRWYDNTATNVIKTTHTGSFDCQGTEYKLVEVEFDGQIVFSNLKEIQFVLSHGQVYKEKVDFTTKSFVYKREFDTSGNWEGLVLPVSILYTDKTTNADTKRIFEEYDIAELFDVNVELDNDETTIKNTYVQAIKVKNGARTKANVPYLIRRKVPPTTNTSYDLRINDAGTPIEVKKAESLCIQCSDIERDFHFYGTYTGINAPNMKGRYALANGKWSLGSNKASLLPERIYLDVIEKTTTKYFTEIPEERIQSAPMLKIVVRDSAEDFDEDFETGIEEVASEDRTIRVPSSLIGLPDGTYQMGGKRIVVEH